MGITFGLTMASGHCGLDGVPQRSKGSFGTNSKEVRKLRQVLKDPVAKDAFLSTGETIETALQTLGPPPAKKNQGLVGDIDQISESIKRFPWTTLASMKGDQQVLRKLEEAETLIRELKKVLLK